MHTPRYIDANPIIKFINDGLNEKDKEKNLGHDGITILAEIEYAPTVETGKWINAREKQPEDQQEVLVCTRSKNGVRNIDKGYWSIDRYIHRGSAEVTHWMPLPGFPEEEKA